jgi:hypothetical protein
MKLFQSFFTYKKRPARKTIKDYQHEVLIRYGKEQFKKLLRLHSVPVVLL